MQKEDHIYYEVYFGLRDNNIISKIINNYEKNKLIRKTFLGKNIYLIANFHPLSKKIEPIMNALYTLLENNIILLEISQFERRPKWMKYRYDKYVRSDSKKFIAADIRLDRKIWLSSRKDKFNEGFYKKHNTIEKLIVNLTNQYIKSKRFSELYNALSEHQRKYINFLMAEINHIFFDRSKRFYELDAENNYTIFHSDVTTIIAYINDIALMMQIMLYPQCNICISYGSWHIYNLIEMMKKIKEFSLFMHLPHASSL